MSQADDELDVYHRRVFYGFGWWNHNFFGPNDAESVGNDQNDIIFFFSFAQLLVLKVLDSSNCYIVL